MAKNVLVPLDFVQQASTATPAASTLRVYAKTDGKLYVKKPDGSEIAVGSGGGQAFAFFAT